VDDKTGLLDPLLLALAPVPGEPNGQLSSFRFSCAEAVSNGVSVVSPKALGAFFAEECVEIPRRTFWIVLLQNLGLNDNHCEVIVQELVRSDDALSRPINVHILSGNLSIGQRGYAALLGLLNRRFDMGRANVDDQNWNATFDLVVSMNHKHHRGRSLKNSVFPSKAMLVNFFAELNRTDDQSEKLNVIWYTLRENSDLISTERRSLLAADRIMVC
jgi:hypothetical protein